MRILQEHQKRYLDFLTAGVVLLTAVASLSNFEHLVRDMPGAAFGSAGWLLPGLAFAALLWSLYRLHARQRIGAVLVLGLLLPSVAAWPIHGAQRPVSALIGQLLVSLVIILRWDEFDGKPATEKPTSA